MKKTEITREVARTKFNGWDGYKITSPDGEFDRFFPAIIREPKTVGCSETVEISAEFFHYLARLQSQGVRIVFMR